MSQNERASEAPIRAPASVAEFLIHNEGDHVAIAVQDVEPGERRAVYMDSDREVTIPVTEAIPLGHKVALVAHGEGEEVIEYGVCIGVTRQPIKVGQHIHIHNIRSARWQHSR